MTAAVSARQLEDTWKPAANPWLITIAVMLGTFMEVLDTSVANVALPHIGGTLSATTDEAMWVLTSYLVSNAIVLPLTGWLSRRFGRKRFLLTCLVIFTLASLMCGAATTLGMLVVARVIQGAGGGALQPIAQAILLESFPPAKRAGAMAAYTLGIIFAPVIGPTVGGWITDNYSWRWVFYINVPVGILAVLMVSSLVEDPPHIRHAPRTKVDFLGFGLLMLWLAAFQIMLDQGEQYDWFASYWIRGLGLTAVVGFIAFVIWELTVEDPIVDLRVLKDRNLATGTFLVTIIGIALYGTTALIPLFLQTLLGYPAMQSGMAVSPRGLGSLVAIVLVGRLLGKTGPRFWLILSLGLLGYSSWLLGSVNLDITSMSVTWPIIINGFAVSALFIPLSTTTMSTLPREKLGSATGLYNLMRNLGGAIGISSLTALLSRGTQVHQAAMAGHISLYDPAAQQRLQAFQQALATRTDPVTAQHQAYGLMYRMLQQQSSLWAFVDNFRLVAIMCVVCIPFVFLFKKGSGGGGGPVEAH